MRNTKNHFETVRKLRKITRSFCSTPILSSIFLIFTVACTSEKGIEAKSKEQNEQLRAKYETLLFNHLRTRGEWPMDKRYRSIRQMADEGFEPAALALRLFDIEHSDLKQNDAAAQIRMGQLAEQGNPTAQCLYAFYWNYHAQTDEKDSQWKRYVRQASDRGVAFCMYWESVNLRNDNPKEKLELEFNAARKGDLSAQSGMAFHYEKGMGVDKDLAKATCWAIEAKKSNTDWGRGLYQGVAYFYRQENPGGLDKLTQEFCSTAISSL